jgi:hypothetical protein
MHSTFSRVRHSSSTCAPDISFVSVAEIKLSSQQKNVALNAEGHQRVFVRPLVAFRFLFRSPSGGAGYGDLNNNRKHDYAQ